MKTAISVFGTMDFDRRAGFAVLCDDKLSTHDSLAAAVEKVKSVAIGLRDNVIEFHLKAPADVVWSPEDQALFHCADLTAQKVQFYTLLTTG